MRTDPDAGRGDQPRWRKSRASNPSGNCVEIAMVDTRRIAVRDSWHPDGGVLVFPSSRFRALLVAARCDLCNGRHGTTSGPGHAVSEPGDRV